MGDRSKIAWLIGASALSLMAVPAQAQTQPASDVVTNEIVVTATRRNESIQKVPISITALSEAAIQRSGADSFADYTKTIPGLVYNENGANSGTFAIRGISTGTLAGNTQSPVAVYYDDLPTLDTYLPLGTPDLRLFDVERVEVLRGPQGTLFGSGALGGAIRIITNKPVMNEFAGKAEGTVEATDGGRPSFGANLAVNVPLVTDKLAARVVGYYRRDGGWVDNVATGRDNVNKQDSYSVRGLLRFVPSEALTITANVSYQRDKPKDSAYVTYGNAGYTYTGATPQFVTNKSFVANLVGDLDLGSAKLTSSTTYAKRTNDSVRDFTPVITAVYGLTAPSPGLDAITTKSLAQELRLASTTDGPFQWLLGGFYLRNKQHIDENIATPGFGAAFGYPTDQSLFGFYNVKSIEKALFGELSYNITEKLKATAGVRLVWNHVTLFSQADGDLNGGLSVLDRSSKDDAVTPKFALSYQATRDVLLYAQAAKGYRVGQNNLTPLNDPTSGLPIPPNYKSDSLWNYEGGIKSTILGGRVTANASVYYIDWKNIQLKTLSATGFSYVGNAGTAESYGAELELHGKVTSALELGTAVSFNHNKLKTVATGAAATVGDRLPGTPRFAISNFAQYTYDLGDGSAVYLRVAHQYSGMAYSDFRNATALQFGDYNRFDARLGWRNDRFELVGFVDNITNQDSFTNAVRLSNGPAAIRMRPRTFGLTARTQF